MSGQTPGQAAYEASQGTTAALGGTVPPWGGLPDYVREFWDSTAQAAIDAFLAGDSVSAESIREALAAQEQPAPGMQPGVVSIVPHGTFELPPPGQAAPVDPSSIAYRVHAHAFNTLTKMMSGDEWFVPLSEREAIASAIVGAIEPLIRADERAAYAQEQPAPGGARQALEEAVERAIRATPAGSGSAAVMRAVDAYVFARSRDAQPAHETPYVDALIAKLNAKINETEAALAALRSGIAGLAAASAPETAEALRRLLETP